MKRNRMATVGVAAAGLLLLALVTPIVAHHSTTMFVSDKTTTLEGTMTEVAWGNPHSLFFVDAKPQFSATEPRRVSVSPDNGIRR